MTVIAVSFFITISPFSFIDGAKYFLIETVEKKPGQQDYNTKDHCLNGYQCRAKNGSCIDVAKNSRILLGKCKGKCTKKWEPCEDKCPIYHCKNKKGSCSIALKHGGVIHGKCEGRCTPKEKPCNGKCEFDDGYKGEKDGNSVKV